jgi:hypothetical protein
MDIQLTIEQAYELKRLELSARSMSRDRLVHELLMLQCRLYATKSTMESCARSMGVTLRLEERIPVGVPDSMEELEDMLGYSLSEEEASDYMYQHVMAESGELDMEAIVMGADE